jgi:phosphate/sulfate permease
MKTVKSSKILFVLAVLGGIALAAGPAAAQTTVVQFDGSSTYDLTTLQSVELNFVSPAPLVLDAAYGVPTLTSNALYTAVNNTPINGTWTTGGGGNGLFVLEGNAALVFSTATTTLTNTAGTTYGASDPVCDRGRRTCRLRWQRRGRRRPRWR